MLPCIGVGQQGESAVSLFMKAEQYRKVNNLNAAIQHYDLAIKKDPYNHMYHFQKGQCCMLLRNYACAIKSFEDAISNYPEVKKLEKVDTSKVLDEVSAVIEKFKHIS
ncbi:MAG: tetratricopeptide repeat protein, partial [Flammeovirgaceae bacterium]